MSRAARELRTKATGRPVLDDVHGLMAYPAGGVDLVRGEARSYRTVHPDLLRNALQCGLASPGHPEQRLAFDLYSAAKAARSIDARFVLLMMAVESMMTPSRRPTKVCDLLAQAQDEVRESDLSIEQRNQLLSQLGQLKTSSLTEQGVALAQSLKGSRYSDKSPADFFRECYGVRSKLVHGDKNRPEQGTLTKLTPHLARFVGDLIAGPDLVAGLRESRAEAGSDPDR
jgi:hypothetical protein